MPGNVATGFGKVAFGQAPFGTVNWAKEHFDLIPEKTQERDADEAEGNLQKFVDSIVSSFNFLVDKTDDFTDLIDPNAIPIELLPNLAETYSIELEQILSDRAQRGFVQNAVKWMALKGTEQGYKIRANTSGFGVTVIPLYRVPIPIDALVEAGAIFEIPPGSGIFFTDKAPLLPLFDETPADVVPTDTFLFEYGDSPPEGIVFHDVSDCTWCKTSQLRVVITTEDLDLQPDVSVSEALQSIVNKLVDVRPAHVRISQIVFQIDLNVNISVGATVETFGSLTTNEPVTV